MLHARLLPNAATLAVFIMICFEVDALVLKPRGEATHVPNAGFKMELGELR